MLIFTRHPSLTGHRKVVVSTLKENLMSHHGSFSGNPKTEWLVDESGADRNMRLLKDFFYTDPDGVVPID